MKEISNSAKTRRNVWKNVQTRISIVAFCRQKWKPIGLYQIPNWSHWKPDFKFKSFSFSAIFRLLNVFDSFYLLPAYRIDVKHIEHDCIQFRWQLACRGHLPARNRVFISSFNLRNITWESHISPNVNFSILSLFF